MHSIFFADIIHGQPRSLVIELPNVDMGTITSAYAELFAATLHCITIIIIMI